MSTTEAVQMNEAYEVDNEEYPEDAPELRYRSVSGLAIFSLVSAVLSLPCLILPPPIGVLFMGGAFLAIVLGFIATRVIKHRPDEFTGLPLSWFGMISGALLLTISIGWNAYVTATEVPEGYTRINFYELQRNNKNPELPFSKRALELNGKRVYIKGYTYPSDQRFALKQFILVKDQGTCCFGGTPEPTHMMDVTFKDGLTIDYGFLQRGVGGILRVESRPRHGELGGVFFRLEADHLR